MKNIKLTEDHKSKLLEMCKVLFLEYPEIRFKENHILLYNKDTFNNIKNQLGKEFENILLQDYECDIKIHWFEFCMTHLARMLMCKNTKHMQQLFMGLKHPVDYLYEEFKKLK